LGGLPLAFRTRFVHRDVMVRGGGLPGIPTAMAYVALVTLLVGIGLFVLPPYGELPLSHQVVLAGVALALWCFSDGLFGRFSVILALIEAVLLLRLAIGWTRLLVEAFGNPGWSIPTPGT
jgi:hypothetical protein